MAGIVIALLCADTLLWWRTTDTIEAEIEARRAALETAGWTMTVEQSTRGGWPFGAWVIMTSPHLLHERSTRAPFDAGWSGTRLRVGGLWPDLIQADFPVLLSGRHAARFISPTHQLTILSQDLHLRFSADHETTFASPSTQIALTTGFLDQSIALTGVSGRLLTIPNALHDSTRLGLELSAQTLNSPALNSLKLSFRNAHLVAALTPSAQKDASSFFSPEGYDRLLLQTATFSIGSEPDASRLSFSGSLDLPAVTGHLTLTLLNWHNAAEQLLNTACARTTLSPDLQAILQHMLREQPSSILKQAQPLVVDLPILNGHFPLSLETLLQNISTQKIDVSH